MKTFREKYCSDPNVTSDFFERYPVDEVINDIHWKSEYHPNLDSSGEEIITKIKLPNGFSAEIIVWIGGGFWYGRPNPKVGFSSLNIEDNNGESIFYTKINSADAIQHEFDCVEDINLYTIYSLINFYLNNKIKELSNNINQIKKLIVKHFS